MQDAGYKMLSDLPDLHTHGGRHVLAGCLTFVPAEFNLMTQAGRQAAVRKTGRGATVAGASGD